MVKIVFSVMVAIGVLVFNLYRVLDDNITASRAELAGLEVIKPLHKLVQQMQQHRGMSAGVIYDVTSGTPTGPR